MTPNKNNGIYMSRKLPDLPVFGGHAEHWPIFYCAFTETRQKYNCMDLDNNQGFKYDFYLQPVEWYSSGIRFSENNLAKIVPFATRVSILTAILQSDQHLENPTHIKDLVAKLPISKRVKSARHSAMIKPFPTIVDFSAWLTEYANLVCTTVDVEGKDPRRRLLHESIGHDHGDQQGRLRIVQFLEGNVKSGTVKNSTELGQKTGSGM